MSVKETLEDDFLFFIKDSKITQNTFQTVKKELSY